MPPKPQPPRAPEAGAKGAGLKKGDEDAPANAVTAVVSKKEPPPEKPESIRLRGYVILSFWAIVILVGLPIWWWTTTIYRASLPLDQMMDWAEGRVRIPQESAANSRLTLAGLSTSLSSSNIN
jgi:GPI-anchor transamidase subunit S